jgi:hypothetical protein
MITDTTYQKSSPPTGEEASAAQQSHQQLPDSVEFRSHLLHLHWQHQHLQLWQQCWGCWKVVQMEMGHCCLPVCHPAPMVLVVLDDLLSKIRA